MHKKLLFLLAAKNDAHEIELYIADDDPVAAQRFRVAFKERPPIFYCVCRTLAVCGFPIGQC
ncbi:MAG: hypothetical protein AAB968_04450 [Patescibacteria group bacterium]